MNVVFNGLTTGAPLNPAEAPMFWDLRAPSLETQALEPIKAIDEMRGRGQRDLLAFLRALDDAGFDRTSPARVPSRLSVGGRVAP